MRPDAEIDRCDCQRLVHGHHEIAGAIDPASCAERVGNGLAERDAEILDGVVLVDIEIADGRDVQIEAAVARHELEHVVQETNAGLHAVAAPAVERDGESDGRLARASLDHAAPHKTSSMAAIPRLVCSTSPVAILMQPAQPGSLVEA